MRSPRCSRSRATTRRSSSPARRSTRASSPRAARSLTTCVVYRLKADHFLLVVNAANLFKDYAWIAEHIASAGDAVAVDTSSRYALLAVQGPAAARRRPAADGRGPVVARALTRSPTARSPTSAPPSRGPATPARMVSKSSSRRSRPTASGRRPGVRPGRRARPVRPRRPGHAPPRSRDAALRQRHRRDDDGARGRPGLDRRLAEEPISSAPPRCGRRRPPACAETRGLRAGRSGNRPPRARMSGRRRQGRGRHQRHADAVPEEIDRHGLSCRPTRPAPGTEIEIDIRGRTARARVVPLPFYKRTTEPEGHR